MRRSRPQVRALPGSLPGFPGRGGGKVDTQRRGRCELQTRCGFESRPRHVSPHAKVAQKADAGGLRNRQLWVRLPPFAFRRRARVTQPAEVVLLKRTECGFDSRRAHLWKALRGVRQGVSRLTFNQEMREFKSRTPCCFRVGRSSNRAERRVVHAGVAGSNPAGRPA